MQLPSCSVFPACLHYCILLSSLSWLLLHSLLNFDLYHFVLLFLIVAPGFNTIHLYFITVYPELMLLHHMQVCLHILTYMLWLLLLLHILKWLTVEYCSDYFCLSSPLTFKTVDEKETYTFYLPHLYYFHYSSFSPLDYTFPFDVIFLWFEILFNIACRVAFPWQTSSVFVCLYNVLVLFFLKNIPAVYAIIAGLALSLSISKMLLFPLLFPTVSDENHLRFSI